MELEHVLKIIFLVNQMNANSYTTWPNPMCPAQRYCLPSNMLLYMDTLNNPLYQFQTKNLFLKWEPIKRKWMPRPGPDPKWIAVIPIQ